MSSDQPDEARRGAPAGQDPTWHDSRAGSWQGQEHLHPGAQQPQTPPPPPYAGSTKTGPKKRRRAPYIAAGVAALLVLGAGGYVASQGLADGRDAGQSTNAEQRWPAGAPPVQQADASAPDWTATAGAVSPSVVSITVGDGQGSGVILDTEGHVVTNHHVVAAGGRGGSVVVTLADKRAYTARLVGTDPSTDLAVLALQDAPDDLRPITMGQDDDLKVGEPVMAVGNPLGLAGTVTTGIVSALNRPVTTTQQSDGPLPQQGGDVVVTNAIQTSAAINPGNSGGALVNSSGQLIGINSSIASTGQGGGNIGIGFAIPVGEVRSVSEQILTSGRVRHSFMGATGRDGVVQDGGARRAAAVLGQITPGSPAAQAGLRGGDAIVAVDGDTVDSWLSLVAQVRERNVGESITVTTVRGGDRQDVQVTLAENPQG